MIMSKYDIIDASVANTVWEREACDPFLRLLFICPDSGTWRSSRRTGCVLSQREGE